MAWHPPRDPGLERLAVAIGSAVLAHGILAVLRLVSWESGVPDLGEADDIERRVEWSGEPGALVAMLVAAEVVAEAPDAPGRYLLQGWLDRAPSTVRRCLKRAEVYREVGISIRDLRSTAGKKSGEARKAAREKRAEQLALLEAEPVAPRPRRVLTGRAKKSPADPRFAVLRAAWEQEFKAATGEVPRWSPADARGVQRIIDVPPDELRERARRSLRSTGFLHCGSLAKLTSNEVWNQLAGPGANGTTKHRVTAGVGDFSKPESVVADWDRALGREPGHGRER